LGEDVFESALGEKAALEIYLKDNFAMDSVNRQKPSIGQCPAMVSVIFVSATSTKVPL
jgi:hypothetical protein